MKTQVMGGAGFIGSNLVDALVAGRHEVTVIDNLTTGKASNVCPGVPLYQDDITDTELVGETVQRTRPEVIFHMAAQIDVRRSVADPAFDARTNILGMVNVLQAATANGVRRVVFSSTGGALYGEPAQLPADEATPILPLSPYGVAKYCAEQYLSYERRLYGLEAVTLRYANVFGPRQDPLGEAGVIAIFTRQVLTGEQPVIYGDGEQTRDFVFVGDVVRADLLAMEGPQGTYNIGTGVETSINELIRLFSRITGRPLEPVYRPARAGEVRRITLDAGLARRGLGWKPAVPLEDGLAQTIEWYRKKCL